MNYLVEKIFKFIDSLYMLYICLFKVITKEQAINLGLSFRRNVYGDEINQRNCRSIWEDIKGSGYRVSEFIEQKNIYDTDGKIYTDGKISEKLKNYCCVNPLSFAKDYCEYPNHSGNNHSTNSGRCYTYSKGDDWVSAKTPPSLKATDWRHNKPFLVTGIDGNVYTAYYARVNEHTHISLSCEPKWMVKQAFDQLDGQIIEITAWMEFPLPFKK
jgi:hypothetical protein